MLSSLSHIPEHVKLTSAWSTPQVRTPLTEPARHLIQQNRPLLLGQRNCMYFFFSQAIHINGVAWLFWEFPDVAGQALATRLMTNAPLFPAWGLSAIFGQNSTDIHVCGANTCFLLWVTDTHLETTALTQWS